MTGFCGVLAVNKERRASEDFEMKNIISGEKNRTDKATYTNLTRVVEKIAKLYFEIGFTKS